MKKRQLKLLLSIANQTVLKQMKHIEMLNRQLEQSDLYITRKDEENAVLKRMYRDDIINGEYSK